MPRFEYDVFLSFASRNEKMARPLYERLTESGLRVFWSDEALRDQLGQSWFNKLQESLESSKHLVLLWSEEAQHSEFVKLEYQTFYSEFGMKADRHLIPVLVNGIAPETLPLFLRQLQSYPLEGEFKELIERVGGTYETLWEANERLRVKLKRVKVENAELQKLLREEKSLIRDKEHSVRQWQNKYDELEDINNQQGDYIRQLVAEKDTLSSKIQIEKESVLSLIREKEASEAQNKARIARFVQEAKKKDSEFKEITDMLYDERVHANHERNNAQKIKSLFTLVLIIGGTILGVLIVFSLFWGIQTAKKTSDDFPRFDFAYIPPGDFTRGSKKGPFNESPVHKVEITRGFYISRTEVTQAYWNRVMNSNPSTFKGPNLPVETVSWYDVQEFIEQLNKIKKCENCYRLPTEAEWEYVASTGGNSIQISGSNGSPLGDYAWYKKNSNRSTHPVATKDSSNWGVYDMHGNVWEWVQDAYSGEYYEQFQNKIAIDPTGPDASTIRVFRGGSWKDDAEELSITLRNAFGAENKNNYLGFRIVKVIPAP